MAGLIGQDQKDENDPAANGLQAPVTPGTTSRDQVAAATGASTGPAASGGAASAAPGPTPGSAAPMASPGNAQAAGKPPTWTNLSDFLGAQSAAQTGSVTQGAVDTAAKNTAATTGAANTAAQAAKGQVAAGTNTGSVGTASAGSPGGVFGAPSYDLSHVNLAGYTGPSASMVAGQFSGANDAAAKAQIHATALRSGHVAANAYDNALATGTPNWSRVLGAAGAEDNAATDAGAQAAGAGEAANQAAGTSGASVAKQKADLGTAAKSINDNAALSQKYVQGYSSMLSGPDPQGALTQLAGDPKGLQALGLSAEQASALRDGLRRGQLSAQQVRDTLASYADAAGKSTGYTADSAGQANQINGLLGNGAPTAAAGPQGAGALSATDAAAKEKQNASAVATLQQAASHSNQAAAHNASGVTAAVNSVPLFGNSLAMLTGNVPQSANTSNAQTKAAVQSLLNAKYTPQQIEQMTGLSPDQFKQVAG